MSGWGMSVTGLSQTVSMLEDVSVQFDGSTTYLVGPTVEYAVHQEMGTSNLEGQPFARPAADRVRSDTGNEIQRIASSQGIALDSEDAVVRCAALAVQERMKAIADQKDIRDTGQLIASIRIEKVS